MTNLPNINSQSKLVFEIVTFYIFEGRFKICFGIGSSQLICQLSLVEWKCNYQPLKIQLVTFKQASIELTPM